MELLDTDIPGLVLIKPDVFEDSRGYFLESYNTEKFRQLGLDLNFMQDNESRSQKNVLRGLHFQNPPYEQGKLVRVIKGAALDVAVDIRKDSLFYGKWYATILSEHNKLMFWIPPGFAHGFLSLEDDTVFFYKCTQVYNKESEGCIIWNDPDINIQWEVDNPVVSEKDLKAPNFKDFRSQF